MLGGTSSPRVGTSEVRFDYRDVSHDLSGIEAGEFTSIDLDLYVPEHAAFNTAHLKAFKDAVSIRSLETSQAVQPEVTVNTVAFGRNDRVRGTISFRLPADGTYLLLIEANEVAAVSSDARTMQHYAFERSGPMELPDDSPSYASMFILTAGSCPRVSSVQPVQDGKMLKALTVRLSEPGLRMMADGVARTAEWKSGVPGCQGLAPEIAVPFERMADGAFSSPMPSDWIACVESFYLVMGVDSSLLNGFNNSLTCLPHELEVFIRTSDSYAAEPIMLSPFVLARQRLSGR